MPGSNQRLETAHKTSKKNLYPSYTKYLLKSVLIETSCALVDERNNIYPAFANKLSRYNAKPFSVKNQNLSMHWNGE
jgi:hypothetical protein